MTGATIKDSAVAKLTNIPKLPEYSYNYKSSRQKKKKNDVVKSIAVIVFDSD